MDSKNNDVVNKRSEPDAGVLYVVGTPIGNLGDLSPRARLLLQQVSTIACEDTRHSGKLLKDLGSKASLLSFHRHNTTSRIPKLLALLKEGKSLAIISDAGLPGISDPGEKLVSASQKAGHDVICIPGPCAATTALVVSGLPSERFCFEGFLPLKGNDRHERLSALAEEHRTTIIYESPHRLLKLLKDLIEICGEERPLQVGRELTKRHEENIGPTIGAVQKHFIKTKPIGEFTLVLGGAPKIKQPQSNNSDLLDQMHKLIAEGATASDAARTVSFKTGQSRRFLYLLLHKKSNKVTTI